LVAQDLPRILNRIWRKSNRGTKSNRHDVGTMPSPEERASELVFLCLQLVLAED